MTYNVFGGMLSFTQLQLQLYQLPEISILRCISCLQQLFVTRGQVIGDVLEPVGAWSSRGLLQDSGVS